MTAYLLQLHDVAEPSDLDLSDPELLLDVLNLFCELSIHLPRATDLRFVALQLVL